MELGVRVRDRGYRAEGAHEETEALGDADLARVRVRVRGSVRVRVRVRLGLGECSVLLSIYETHRHTHKP